jgi:Tfp pilus assembly protein PilV
VLIALVVLATAGTGLVTLIGQTAHTMRSTRDSERETLAASAELNRLLLLDAGALFALAGRHESHGWTIDVAPRSRTLFELSIAPSDTSAALLRTTLYRPDTTDATP